MNKKSTGIKNTLIFIIIMVTLCNIQAIDITVANNGNEMGFDNSSCLLGIIHCFSLDFVFTNLSDCNHNPISVSILDGNYSFTLSSTVTDNLFNNCPVINITGINSSNTKIVCGIDAGFAFHNIPQVKIANISFSSCGSVRNSTSIDLTLKSPNATLLLSAALYFVYCKDVQIVNVTVQNSNSTGVVMYNTYGELLVEASSFIGNGNQDNLLPSNGGFYIEFVYCDPGKVDDNCIQQKNSYAKYHINSNDFSCNDALNETGDTLFYVPYKTNYYSFGRGGGLSIIFKGNASNNIVLIDNCRFYENGASWGGGLLVEFEDFTKNNTMTINNTNFSTNWVIASAENGYGTAGGGARIGFVILQPKSVENNSVVFENCLFTKNTALYGGGFGMYMPSEPNVINTTNSLSFCTCSWIANKALLGSAVDLNHWRTYTAGAKMEVKFSACRFYDNENTQNFTQTTRSVWEEFNSFGTGALYAYGIPLIFEEYVEFSNNYGSALAIYDTIASFYDNCNVTFINNNAWMGGAIALLGASQMWIYPHTVFLFKNNKAKLRGGAIYVLQTSRHDLLSGGNCFLHYNDESVSSPDEWNTSFTFESNQAPFGTSIFATTLLSCAWGASFGDLNFNLLKVLNWTQFTYSPSDTNTIATEVSKINIHVNISTPAEIIPGKYSKLPITTVDDKGNSITRSLWLVSNNESVLQVSQNLTDNSSIILRGMPNNNVEFIQIVTDGSRIVSAKLPVKIVECPPGYYLDLTKDNNQTCECSFLNNIQRLDGILVCDRETFTAKISRSYWAGYHMPTEQSTPNDTNLVTGQCPRHYCNVQEQEISLPNTSNITLLNEMFCSPVNRNGILCGMCSNGYGVAINSIFFDCVNCSQWLSQHGWMMYILTEYVPSTLLFCLILFFDINLHSGTISTVILYFQVFDILNIYSDKDLNPPSHSDDILTSINFAYNIWNLEFFGFFLPPYCLSKQFNTMDVLLIKYISGIYPFLLLLIYIVFLYFNFCGLERLALCFSYIRNCYTRIKIIITRRGSTINGLATLWTLVFTKFALISALILSRENLTGSENSGLNIKVAWLDGSMPLYGEKHLPYVIPAVFVLGFLVIIPALGLLCYPLVPQIMGSIQNRYRIDFNQYKPYKIMSSMLEKPFIHLKPLIDCFQRSCKARCEFYAALLLWYRLSVIFVYSFTVRTEIYFYSTAVSVIFVIMTDIIQPYKKHRDNVITILCISNIILINLISICHLYYSETQVSKNTQPLLWLQIVLILLPFVFFVVFVVWRSWRKFKGFWWQEPLYAPIYVNDDNILGFPRRVLEDSESDKENTNNRSPLPCLQSASGSSSLKGLSHTGSSEVNNVTSSSGSFLMTDNTTDNH